MQISTRFIFGIFFYKIKIKQVTRMLTISRKRVVTQGAQVKK